MLALAGALVKVIGLVYKIPLTNLIKSEGMGYFNSAYTIYTFFYMISTAGLPVAISLLVSQARAVGNRPRVKKIFTTATAVFLAIGTLGGLAMFFFADFFASLLGNAPAAPSIRAIAPTLFFVSIISVLRGYFQGHQYMLPTAISQIAEAAGKLGFGIFLARSALSLGKGYEFAAAGAATGLSIGMGIAFIYLVITAILFKSDKYYEQIFDTMPSGDGRSIMRALTSAALPITLSASVLSMSSTLDLATVMRTLRDIGFSSEAANAAYGNYSALAVPMFNLPIVLITPIASTVVPYLAGAVSARDEKKISSAVSLSLRVTALISFPCALGLCALSSPILRMLFDDALADAASPLLAILAPSVIFLSFATVTNALLQALGRPLVPLFSMLAGAAAKILLCPLLIRRFSISGTPMSTFVCYFTVCFINFAVIYRKMREKPSFFGMLLRPLAASVLSSLAATVTFSQIATHLGETLACLVSIALAVVVYAVSVTLTGYLGEQELLMLPKGERLLEILKKIRFVKGSKGIRKNERSRVFEGKGRAQDRRSC